jgi:hypothetical protein
VAAVGFVLCFGEEIGFGRNLREEIGTYLKYTLQALAGGIEKIACLVAESQFPCGFPVFAGRNKFRSGGQ